MFHRISRNEFEHGRSNPFQCGLPKTRVDNYLKPSTVPPAELQTCVSPLPSNITQHPGVITLCAGLSLWYLPRLLLTESGQGCLLQSRIGISTLDHERSPKITMLATTSSAGTAGTGPMSSLTTCARRLDLGFKVLGFMVWNLGMKKSSRLYVELRLKNTQGLCRQDCGRLRQTPHGLRLFESP